MDFGGRVQFLQAQLFPVCPMTPTTTAGGRGFLGSFLSKGLKTNQLEVNTDEKTLRPIARLKEPRDLFALPKDKDHDCSQQAPRWPIECQVIEERVMHISYVPSAPEPYYQPTGNELKPRPVGEENGVVVYNYNPISAVNYDKPKKSKRQDSSDSDISSSESRGSTPECSTPDRRKRELRSTFSQLLKTLHQRSSSNSNDEFDDDENEDDEEPNSKEIVRCEGGATPKIDNITKRKTSTDSNDIDDIWGDKSPEYQASTPTYIKSQFGKELAKIEREPVVMAKAVAPVRFDPEQMARLELGKKITSKRLSRSSSSSSLSTDASDDGENDDDDDDGGVVGSYGGKTKSKLNLQNSKSKSKTINLNTYLGSKSAPVTPRALSTEMQLEHASSPTRPHDPFTPTSNDSQDNEDFNFDSLPQFSRSAVGGSKFLTNCHPYNSLEYDGLEFESRFESGNLAKAVKITQTYYELYLRPDLYTSRSKQWFYFRVKRTKKNLIYRFSIVNLVKSDSLYNEGMRPLMYSTINAKQIREGWRRCGENICYYRNDEENSNEEDEENNSYTLTFNVEFQHDDDTVYFAHSYPYTYSELQDYLMDIQKHPVKSKFCKLRLLCRTLAGNNVYYLTVTAPTADEEAMKRKKSIVVSARVHPSETPSSWMMKGLMDFITSESSVAKRLRHKFIFKLIPMLNPDGVIVGNTRNSLTGKDLNRQYRTVIRETYPSIWYTKAMIKRLIDECGVSMYCDMHAHSRKHNIFIYGCENKRNPEKKLTEQVFPLMMHKNVADKFSFESCKFKIQRSKEGTGRIVVWMLGITNSYTIEASFGGSSLGSRKGTHFTTMDYEHMGRAFCETLLDYCDENPNKERLRLKIIERLLKEGSSADEPLNIPLSDYSSDEGDSSSSSDNEGKGSISLSDLEGPCCVPLRAPPCSPEIDIAKRKFKYKRMRKIMIELDRIYFTPLFQKRLRAMIKSKKAKPKPSRPKKPPAEWISGDVAAVADEDKRLEGGAECSGTVAELRRVNRRSSDKSLKDSSSPTVSQDSSETLKTVKSSATELVAEGATKRKKCTRRKSKKKRKSKSDLIGEHAALRSRVKVSRKLRLWLITRRIIIFRVKKTRKSKIRSKSHGHRKKNVEQRTPLDMPTTDPGSDIHFSTDDDECIDTCHAPCEGFITMPRTRRTLLQSELQRRYIEEIGDGSTNALKRIMPPELIVTSPNKQTTSRISATYSYKQLPKTAPDQSRSGGGGGGQQNHGAHGQGQHVHLSEFPPIGLPARRTNSWHHLNSSGRSLTKLRIHNPYQISNTPDKKSDLEFMLSLKKKIWTGIQPDAGSNYVDRSRPLSWGVPPLGAQVKRRSVSSARAQKRDENEALFTACSQRLLAWQQQPNNTYPSTPAHMPTPVTPTATPKKVSVTLVMSEMQSEAHTMHLFKQINAGKKLQKVSAKLEATEGKTKRKKNPLSKIAETTQILTRLARAKSHSSLSTQRQQKGVTPTSQLYPNERVGHNKLKTQENKFKTGGLVATAVQPSSKKSKKLRALNTGGGASKAGAEVTAALAAGGGIGIGKERNAATAHLELAAAVDSSTFVRKVKTKLRKKKSLSGSSAGLAAVTAVGVAKKTHDLR